MIEFSHLRLFMHLQINSDKLQGGIQKPIETTLQFQRASSGSYATLPNEMQDGSISKPVMKRLSTHTGPLQTSLFWSCHGPTHRLGNGSLTRHRTSVGLRACQQRLPGHLARTGHEGPARNNCGGTIAFLNLLCIAVRPWLR